MMPSVTATPSADASVARAIWKTHRQTGAGDGNASSMRVSDASCVTIVTLMLTLVAPLREPVGPA